MRLVKIVSIILLIVALASGVDAFLSPPAAYAQPAAPVDGGWSYWYWTPCSKG